MNLAIVKTQVRRELWEHKIGFVYAPAIASALFICILAYACFAFLHNFGGQVPFTGNIDFHGGNASYHIDGKDADAGQKIDVMMNDFRTGNPDTLKIIFSTVVGVNFFLIMLVASVVQAVYNFGCLFDDRKNRDILFWRSMPVSETTNVLVKLGMILFAFPLIALALNLLMTLIVFVSASIFLMFQGIAIGSWLLALLKSHALLLPFEFFIVNIMLMLALMPCFGFVLWVSAFAKKSPFLIGALIAIGLLMLDALLQRYLGINLHVIDSLSRYAEFLAKGFDFLDISKNLSGYVALVVPTLLAIAVGGLFVGAAIWFRNHRYEI